MKREYKRRKLYYKEKNRKRREGRQGRRIPKASLQIFPKTFHDRSYVFPWFLLWETLTSDIEGYKKSYDSLRPLLGKEVGTTVLALSGVVF